jgi:predicted RNase H-like HicB family nuclease
MEKITVNIDWSGNYGASSDNGFAVGCLATADSLEEVKKEYAELLDFHFEGMKKDGAKTPLKYSLEFKLTDAVIGKL